MSPDRRLIEKALHTMRPEQRARLMDEALAAERREPRVDPKYADCLMASAGGAAAVYRHVVSVQDGTVHFYYSSQPFGMERRGRCTLDKWRQWATRAVVHHCSSTEIFIRDAGWQLHSDILAVAAMCQAPT